MTEVWSGDRGAGWGWWQQRERVLEGELMELARVTAEGAQPEVRLGIWA